MSKDRKKITFNALLNHKAHNYKPMQIEVEKVIPLYGKRFEQMKNHPLDDCPEIIENRDPTDISISLIHSMGKCTIEGTKSRICKRYG